MLAQVLSKANDMHGALRSASIAIKASEQRHATVEEKQYNAGWIKYSQPECYSFFCRTYLQADLVTRPHGQFYTEDNSGGSVELVFRDT